MDEGWHWSDTVTPEDFELLEDAYIEHMMQAYALHSELAAV